MPSAGVGFGLENGRLLEDDRAEPDHRVGGGVRFLFGLEVLEVVIQRVHEVVGLEFVRRSFLVVVADAAGPQLLKLRFQLGTKQIENTMKIRQVRKDIARVKTLQGERGREKSGS